MSLKGIYIPGNPSGPSFILPKEKNEKKKRMKTKTGRENSLAL
jgi:hypothetical protein